MFIALCTTPIVFAPLGATRPRGIAPKNMAFLTERASIRLKRL
jgi:hypothetical protein